MCVIKTTLFYLANMKVRYYKYSENSAEEDKKKAFPKLMRKGLFVPLS